MGDKPPHPFDGVQTLARLARVLSDFGVVGGAETLQDESVQPQTCMKEARDSLLFMGFAARKWRQEPWLAVHLARLHRRDGHVHFLIGSESDAEGRVPLANLMHSFPGTFEVRVMNGRSLFRLVIIDRHKMLLAHYGHEVIMEDGTNAMGWQSPQLVIEQGSEWSLIIPFMMYYKEIWDGSEPIVPVNQDAAEAARQRRGFG